mmetsp:Transcript_14813/g.19432  ORF Transcript_14813/g.19432 Transcript_14813/m.19432 type:complete len:371 (+) Transcript_14813:440-1552(+)
MATNETEVLDALEGEASEVLPIEETVAVDDAAETDVEDEVAEVAEAAEVVQEENDEIVDEEAEEGVKVPDDAMSQVLSDAPDGDIFDAVNEVDEVLQVQQELPAKEPEIIPKEPIVIENEEEEEDEEEEITTVSFEVKTPAGKKFALKNVHLDATLLEVKQMVAKMDGNLKPHEMKIIKSGKPITDNTLTVREYEIKEGQVLHVVKQLFGAGGAGAGATGGVGIRRERTEEHERGFLKVTIPEGARPGNRLIIQPPGRPRMHIIVPRGYHPGMVLNVKLPDEPASNTTRQHVERRNEPARSQGGGSTASSHGPPTPAQNSSTLMKVQCPRGTRPGSEIKIMVPGRGRMKVQVPANVQPGQFFYFRVMNSY